MSDTIKINGLPAPTFRWLHMNDITVERPGNLGACEVREELPSNMIRSEEKFETRGIPTGLGTEYDEVIEASGVECIRYSIEQGEKAESPLRLDYELDGGDFVSPVFIEAKEDSETVVIASYLSKGDAKTTLASQFRIDIKDRAKVKLVICDLVSKDSEVFCDIGTNIGEEASFELVQLFLSGKNTYVGCRSELVGKGADMQADIAYHKADSDVLDMNYIANHSGRRTTCRMDASGVMRNTSRKIFRGTIDFKKGAAGAKGSENEDVLLIDDGTINQTIPLILCQEEDVEGTHGATIGRLSEDVLFYLQSRGMTIEHIYEMMARARIDAVAAKTDDEITISRVAEAMGA